MVGPGRHLAWLYATDWDQDPFTAEFVRSTSLCEILLSVALTMKTYYKNGFEKFDIRRSWSMRGFFNYVCRACFIPTLEQDYTDKQLIS